MDRKRIDGLPPWVLTPKEEKEVFENWKTTTYKACDELVKKFADCAASSGYSAWFKCRKQSKVMRDCIASRQATKYVDDERDKYIQEKIRLLQEQGKIQSTPDPDAEHPTSSYSWWKRERNP
ncbi:BA75_04037T0 [Komagataella pastoris]|uniref:COX assembly mitochondrial protein n=1 Tax=Komagataella pastoris TaxID=4922 RepID=A0A1B2JFF9_PICPA|nr:BA75_04037T0 [Komagataella pastoris]